VFHPFELLPAAYEEGRFDWDPELDDVREAALRDAAAIVDYAAVRHGMWRAWVTERERDLDARDPAVESPRGAVTFRNLLASQRWHAAYHNDQVRVR
jgi:hypothetical protein